MCIAVKLFLKIGRIKQYFLQFQHFRQISNSEFGRWGHSHLFYDEFSFEEIIWRMTPNSLPLFPYLQACLKADMSSTFLFCKYCVCLTYKNYQIMFNIYIVHQVSYIHCFDYFWKLFKCQIGNGGISQFFYLDNNLSVCNVLLYRHQ